MQFTSDDNLTAAAERIGITAGGNAVVPLPDITSSELMAKLSDKIRDSRLLTESAVKVTKSYNIRAGIRKVPRFLGTVGYAVLTGSIVTAAVFQGGEVEQFKELSDLLNYTDLAIDFAKNVANGDFKEFLNGLWDKVTDNGSGYARYAAWQLALTKAKGLWNTLSDDVLGAYSIGALQIGENHVMQSATVIAAYERLGVPLIINGEAREIEEIKKDINELVERADLMSKTELAHLMRATGVIGSDVYCSALARSVTDKIQAGQMDSASVIIATEISRRPEAHADLLVRMYDLGSMVSGLGTILFTDDEFKKVESLLKSAGVIDAGGEVKSKKKLGINTPREMMEEHILTQLESGDPKAIRELHGIFKCLELAVQRVGLTNLGDIHKVMVGSYSELSLAQYTMGKRVLNQVGAHGVEAILTTSSGIKHGLDKLKEQQAQVNRPRNGLR